MSDIVTIVGIFILNSAVVYRLFVFVCLYLRYENGIKIITFYQRVANVFNFIFFFKNLEKNSMSLTEIVQKLMFLISKNTFNIHVIVTRDPVSWSIPITETT